MCHTKNCEVGEPKVYLHHYLPTLMVDFYATCRLIFTKIVQHRYTKSVNFQDVPKTRFCDADPGQRPIRAARNSSPLL